MEMDVPVEMLLSLMSSAHAVCEKRRESSRHLQTREQARNEVAAEDAYESEYEANIEIPEYVIIKKAKAKLVTVRASRQKGEDTNVEEEAKK